MAERILAVDRAAAMVEEMLKLGQNLAPSSLHSLSNDLKVKFQLLRSYICNWLRFNADHSFPN